MSRYFVAAVLAALALPAAATMNGLRAPGYSGATPPTIQLHAMKAMADDSAGLRQGTLQKVDVRRGTLQVFGQSLTFDPLHVKVVDPTGKPVAASTLKAGAHVRFTLDAGDAGKRRVAVIYVD